MPLVLPDFTTLDAAAVAARQAELAQRIAERHPDVDVERGAVRDVLLYLGGVLLAGIDQAAAAYEASSSLLAVTANPAGADPAIVDRILSNYRVTRRAATPASGLVTVVVSSSVPLVIARGASFTAASGTVYTTPSAFAIRTTSDEVLESTDRALRSLGDGLYAFTIPLTATVPGAAGALRSGTALTAGFVLPGLIRAYAEGDFSGGGDAETNADLVGRLLRGIAAPTLSGRANVDALIRAQPAFAGAVALSFLGAGDAELIRAARGLFPVLQPGRCDVYARLQAHPAAVTLTKTATLVATGGGAGVWQFTITRDDAPGFDRLLRVALPGRPSDEAGLAITDETRGVDLSGSGWRPDVRGAIEAAYTAYQTATIQFRDDRTPTGGLTVGTATAPYTVTVRQMPGLAELQTFLGSRNVRPLGGDVLVRAPVPCDLSVGFTVYRPSAATDPDRDSLRRAVAAAVNALGFPGVVRASTITAAVAPLLPPGSTVGRIDLRGQIRRPDGTTIFLHDPLASDLVIPELPDAMVTPRTVAVYLDPADVTITVTTVPPVT